NPPAKHLTSYGEHYFDALIEVARHPVGAAQINKGLAAVLEVEDSAVLQEPAHDAAHSNLLTDASEVRAQGAGAAHDKVDLDSRPRRAIQCRNHRLIQQRINFCDDPCGSSAAGVVCLAVNEFDAIIGQVNRGHEQRPVIRALGASRQIVEDGV